jgi:hypothetical protein
LFLGWRSNYAHPQEILEFCEGWKGIQQSNFHEK